MQPFRERKLDLHQRWSLLAQAAKPCTLALFGSTHFYLLTCGVWERPHLNTWSLAGEWPEWSCTPAG